MFDRYRVVKALRGGMGVVYLCEDLADRRVVAVKTFPRDLLADGHVREQFVAEASGLTDPGSGTT